MTTEGSPPPENFVRRIHDSVAASDNLAEASVRPPETTPRQICQMQRDVVRKLRLQPNSSVLEIGCGVALLGVPIVHSSARYVGVDFASQAVDRANRRFASARLEARAEARCMDVLASPAAFRELGTFDRVLMYAVFHYARDEMEPKTFLKRAGDALTPGGRALIGSIPLKDLRATLPHFDTAQRSLGRRLLEVTFWTIRPERAALEPTRRWKLRWMLESVVSSRLASPVGAFAPAHLPANYTLSLTTELIEGWLAAMSDEIGYHWEMPAPGGPNAVGRADLVLTKV